MSLQFAVAVIVLLPVVVDIFMILLWLSKKKSGSNGPTLPEVSILVAARNEEKHLEKCLEALLHLDYPFNLVEILVGDDASSDNTLQIASQFSEINPRVKVFPIRENLAGLQGKANVLAQLATKAKGEYLFFTDADVIVPESWIVQMLRGFKKEVGLVSGVTAISGRGLWSRFQSLDWIFALGLVKVVNDSGYAVTALGNNMAVSRQAYDAVGGYENIPFSITEDFELLKQITKKGFTANQSYHQRVLAWSSPEPDWTRLLHQRKRWMRGAVQLPAVVVLVLAIQAVFFPAIIFLFLLDAWMAISVFFVKILVQSIFIYLCLLKIKQKENIIAFLIYEIYSAALSLSLLIFYILPVKISWKERAY